jgi:hypothetical protein
MEATTAIAALAATDSNMYEGSKGDDRSVSSSEQSSFKRLKTCEAALLSAVAKETTPTLEDIPSELFIQHILPFVGRRQYRFVATVNHNFHTAYVTAFSEKVTCFNVPTIEHAKICFDEWKGNYCYPRILCCIAARKGNLTVLKLFRSIHLPWDRSTCAAAAENGHLDVIKWCHENGWPWDENTCANAAKNGHLDVIQWCRENGCPWDENTCWNAAENGHLDVIKWCRQNGCPWNAWTCASAAKNGHLDVLQWCRQNGCRWDEWTCKRAAKYGHIDTLKWCRQNGCEWYQSTCKHLERGGYYDVLQWSFENGCKCIVCSKYGNLD